MFWLSTRTAVIGGWLGLALLLGGRWAMPAGSAAADSLAFNRRWAERFFSSTSDSASLESPAAFHGGGLPFSFVYGGRKISPLAGGWRATVQGENAGGDRELRVLTLTDRATGLEVRAEAIIYNDTGGIDWTLYFTNRGMKETPILEQVQAVDVTVLPKGKGDPILHRLHGSSGTDEDWLPMADRLGLGTRVEFGPSGEQANSSSGACPFFNLQWAGGGLITAVGWTAPWRVTVERGGDGRLRLQAGMQRMGLKLRPGESIRSPRILQLHWFGKDPIEGCNRFRRLMFAHILPQREGQPLTPPIAHTSVVYREEDNCTEADVLSYLKAIEGLGFEVFWLDAYWIRDGYPRGTGHYGFPIRRVEPPDRFPRGLRPIGDAAHKLGLEFLVWFSPETVWAGGELAREHPEWTLFWEEDKPLLDWGQIDLGLPEARQFMTRYLQTAIREYGIDWLRIDSGMIQAFARRRDQESPDRVGMSEIRYVEGLYRMWDEIRAANPGLVIDNCFGGGRRIDLETSSRSLPLWRTDATYERIKTGKNEQVAVLNQMMTAGLSRYVPFSTCGQTGVTPYAFRSGFNGGIVFGDDCRSAGYPKAELGKAVAEGKRIRKYYFGDFYPLVPVTAGAGDWCVLQYHLPAEGEGMILAFRRHESPAAEMELSVRSIDPEGEYDVTLARGFEPPPPGRIPGRKLQRLRVVIDNRPGSLLVEYRRVQGRR